MFINLSSELNVKLNPDFFAHLRKNVYESLILLRKKKHLLKFEMLYFWIFLNISIFFLVFLYSDETFSFRHICVKRAQNPA